MAERAGTAAAEPTGKKAARWLEGAQKRKEALVISGAGLVVALALYKHSKSSTSSQGGTGTSGTTTIPTADTTANDLYNSLFDNLLQQLQSMSSGPGSPGGTISGSTGGGTGGQTPPGTTPPPGTGLGQVIGTLPLIPAGSSVNLASVPQAAGQPVLGQGPGGSLNVGIPTGVPGAQYLLYPSSSVQPAAPGMTPSLGKVVQAKDAVPGERYVPGPSPGTLQVVN